MKRREFLYTSGALLTTCSLLSGCRESEPESMVYLHPSVSEPANSELPDEKRLPFGWKAFAVGAPGATNKPVLKWEKLPQTGPSRLRFTVAVDMREEKIVEVRLAESKTRIGEFDIRFAPVLEPLELSLNEAETRKVADEGVILEMTKGSEPAWFFQVEPNAGRRAALMPHLLLWNDPDPLSEFYDRLASLVSLQPWGWMEGCVLDGLHDLFQATGETRFEEALQDHLSHFFDGQKTLVYESPRSEPRDGVISDIESTLPHAVLARRSPEHPVLDKVIEFWRAHLDAEGCVQDGGMTSAEGSYTVGYPMMVIGAQRNSEALTSLALKQVRLRKERLVHEGDCWLRHHSDGHRTYQNWARGVAWYSLGLVRVLCELESNQEVDDLAAELNRLAGWVSGYQREDGLWNCFLHQDVPPDTSGSAGIAAALAIAVSNELLPDSYLAISQKTFSGLRPFLTPDGLLGGVAQSNRGGESLQQSDYRVISQMGMGLMAQLSAALYDKEKGQWAQF